MNKKSVLRLTDFEIQSIKDVFKTHFTPHDHLWVFGSRVNPQKRGGDLDLYIETILDSLDKIVEKKIQFLVDVKMKIGDQRIDVVINNPKNHLTLPIYQEARNTGILLL